MILLPAGRFLTIPFPPGPLAARFLAAVMRPPLLFFAMCTHLLSSVSLIFAEIVVDFTCGRLFLPGRSPNSVSETLIEPVTATVDSSSAQL
jgi:hypothetical protein